MANTSTFQFATAEEVVFVRKQLGTTEEDIKEAVKSLREWLEMQPHLPNAIDDALIEKMYINCKCSMERTKLGLDAYFSLRPRLPDILMKMDPHDPEIKETKKHIKMLVMPRLTKEGYRIFINTDCNPDATVFHFLTHVKMVLMELEILMLQDYSLGDYLIINLANTSMAHLVKLDVNAMRSAELVYKTAYCRRLKGIHFINAPKIVDFLINLVKSATSEKLQRRIHVHLPNSTTLFDHVDRDWIPNELGGTAGPVDKFSYQLFDMAYELRDWFLEKDKHTSDESKRPQNNRYADDIYGVAGSFKKLNVD